MKISSSVRKLLRKTTKQKLDELITGCCRCWPDGDQKLIVWHLSIIFLAASVIVSDFNYSTSSPSFMVERHLQHFEVENHPKAMFTVTNLTDILLDLWLRLTPWAMQKSLYRENYMINYSSLTSACYVCLLLILHTLFHFSFSVSAKIFYIS